MRSCLAVLFLVSLSGVGALCQDPASEKAAELEERLAAASEPEQIHLLNELAELQRRRNPDKALELTNRSLELATKYEDLRGKALGAGFWEVVLGYDWPGNVREVVNVMKRVGIQFADPEIGSEVEKLLQRRTSRGTGAEKSTSVDSFKAEIAAGESFWDTAWPAFIDREISRRELRAFLSDYFVESQHNLKQTAHRLNIKDTEYPRFVSTLHKYRVHPGQ